MKKKLMISLLSLACVSASAAPSAPTTQSSDEIVAMVGGQPIYMKQISEPMLDAYGLATLMNVVRLELAKQTAESKGYKITQQDVAIERDKLMAQWVPQADKKDYDRILEQLLDQQRLSHQEFDMLVRTRAYLRKIAEPLLAGKIKDDTVREYFNQTYGETIRVRHIQCSNLQEIAEAQRRLANGESFAQVAKALSRNKETGPIGGEMPVFSRETPDIPQAFKDTAFALKVGEVSDPVSAGDAYHLIKMEERIAPKAVKFEDVKDIARKELEERYMVQAQKQLTQEISAQALAVLRIENPILRKQYEAKLHRRDEMIRDREKLREQMEKSRATTQPAKP